MGGLDFKGVFGTGRGRKVSEFGFAGTEVLEDLFHVITKYSMGIIALCQGTQKKMKQLLNIAVT
jgi:hypothetical protein